ncbi:DUF3872 domain-containing protein [Flavobacterium sp.]|uniref:DUF3872 domain-containing protein n=1 Tax=Flavobacterium sp. TaxID=239 RepID=UPI003A94724D
MKHIFNLFSTNLLPACLLLITLSCNACSSGEPEVQDNFPFEVSIMPVPDAIAKKETVEIRITIVPSGNYRKTHYYLRYFQFDGEGTLRYEDRPPFQPNDLYMIHAKEFRLYYTSASTVTQSFDIWISDNFGNEQQLNFQFSSND